MGFWMWSWELCSLKVDVAVEIVICSQDHFAHLPATAASHQKWRVLWLLKQSCRMSQTFCNYILSLFLFGFWNCFLVSRTPIPVLVWSFLQCFSVFAFSEAHPHHYWCRNGERTWDYSEHSPFLNDIPIESYEYPTFWKTVISLYFINSNIRNAKKDCFTPCMNCGLRRKTHRLSRRPSCLLRKAR